MLVWSYFDYMSIDTFQNDVLKEAYYVYKETGDTDEKRNYYKGLHRLIKKHLDYDCLVCIEKLQEDLYVHPCCHIAIHLECARKYYKNHQITCMHCRKQGINSIQEQQGINTIQENVQGEFETSNFHYAAVETIDFRYATFVQQQYIPWGTDVQVSVTRSGDYQL